MAERSEAIVLRKTGGRQNEVLLRTLKRTRLAQRVHVCFNKFSNKKKRPAVLIINGEVRIARVRSVRFCTSTASDALKMFLSL